MGHDVLYCKFCDTPVMEGFNDWECKCGGYYGADTKFTWIKKDRNKEVNCVKEKAIRKVSKLTPFQLFIFNQIWVRASKNIKADFIEEFPDISFDVQEIDKDIKDPKLKLTDIVIWEFFIYYKIHYNSTVKEEVMSVYFKMSKNKATVFYSQIKEYLKNRNDKSERIVNYKDLEKLLTQINLVWYYGNKEYWG